MGNGAGHSLVERHEDSGSDKDRRVAGIVHDLRNHLTLILGSGELALAQLEPGHPARAELGETKRACECAIELARRLLHPDRDGVTAPSSVDLNAIVRGLDGALRLLVGQSVTLTLSLDPGTPAVSGDWMQIERVLVNLVLNARDAVAASGGRIEIVTRGAGAASRFARLTVIDDGSGIPAAVGDRVFEPFLTTKPQGSGLGLANVRDIAAESGGRVWFESDPGRRTAFHVDLPAEGTRSQPAAGRCSDETLPRVTGRTAVRPWPRAARGLVLAALASIAGGCASAPSTLAPSTGSLRGHVELAPHSGLRLAQDGNPYGTAQAHGARQVDYDRPGFAVVYLAGAAAPGGQTTVEYTPRGFVPEYGVVGEGGSIVLRNADREPHTFSVPSAELLRRLDPGEHVEIREVAAGDLALFVLDRDDRMVVFVSPGPYAVATPEGRWSMTGLPPGPATLRTWHPRLPGGKREVSVHAGRVERVRLRIGVDAAGDRPLPEAADRLSASADRLALLGGRIRVSGSSRIGYYGKERRDAIAQERAEVNDARYVVTADLGRSVWLGDTKLLRGIGYLYERELYMVGLRTERMGETYLELRGLLDSDWLNVQVGRFQLPVSENYLRFGRGTPQDPFSAHAVGAPWYNDEGVKLWGADLESGLGYVASLTDGQTEARGVLADVGSGRQITLRVFAEPATWLHLSASALRSAEIGSVAAPANSSVWFGMSKIQPLGARTVVPTLHHGTAIPDGPPVVSGITLVAGDAILESRAGARLWLAAGEVEVEQPGGERYDRDLRYWVAEVQLPGGALSRALDRVGLAVRVNGYGTFDRNEGYLLDMRRSATLGYNMRSLTAASLAASWRLAPGIELRSDFTHTEAQLVRGASPAMGAAARATNTFGLEASVSF